MTALFGGLTWKGLLLRVWQQVRKDRVLDQSAKLSFYFLLSMFPLLLFLTALLGFVLQSDVVQQTVHTYLAAVVPTSTSSLIDKTLTEITHGAGAFKLSAALLFTWWSASHGMLAIIEGLNIAYEVGESRPWWKKQLLASGLTVVFLAAIAAVTALLIFGGRFAEILANHFGHEGFIAGLWRVLDGILLLAFVLMTFNILYAYAPNVKRRQWHWLMPGTVVGVALWLLVSYGFQLYLSFFNRFTVTYGSIGAVIILLLWLYLSGIAILVGGEVNSVIETAAGRVEKETR